MLWLGFAAFGTALAHLAFPGWGPALQWIVFAVLSLVSVAIGWRYRSANPPAPSDKPLLNRRASQLVGKVYVLETAIVNGRGRLKIGDAFWTAVGQDMPAGARVCVTAVEGMDLNVTAAG
jgi:membrane protein implicated in regulation of membrane protease activity